MGISRDVMTTVFDVPDWETKGFITINSNGAAFLTLDHRTLKYKSQATHPENRRITLSPLDQRVLITVMNTYNSTPEELIEEHAELHGAKDSPSTVKRSIKRIFEAGLINLYRPSERDYQDHQRNRRER